MCRSSISLTGIEPLSYSWSFGDGSLSSILKNPVHVYNQTGNYTVNLTVTDANGLSNQSSIVQVTHADDPEGMFTSSVKSGPAPLTVSFIDQSSGTAPLTYAWDFGDLTPIKYEQKPSPCLY